MTIREHRRARWRLRRELRRLVREIITGIRFRIDTVALERRRSRAWKTKNKAAADAYWERYKRHWRVWG